MGNNGIRCDRVVLGLGPNYSKEEDIRCPTISVGTLRLNRMLELTPFLCVVYFTR